MTSLVIVESPAKAKTISKFLGKGYVVEASYGHVRDLPEKADDIPESVKGEKWARFGVNIDANFEPVYVIPESKKKQVEKLKKALKGADELILATDEDREGESISWHLLQILKPKVPVRRIVFHEITPEAIKAAVAAARDVDTRLVNAQESRRVLDRLYGYSLSPVLWKKVQTGLSAGRVQSVAVRLIVEREEERRAFVASEYWDLEAAFAAPTGEFKATLVNVAGSRVAVGRDFDSKTGKLKTAGVRHLDGDAARKLATDAESTLPWRVSKVEGKAGKQRPAPPFTTSTLQQEANRKMGFSADRTMRAAQSLYEGVDLGGGERIGLITYMRTDSTTLAERALHEAQVEIERMYGKDYAQGPRRYKTKSRSAQEAHEAIRPTQLGRRPQDVEAYLSKEESRIYELIWKRTVASQMPDADVLRTVVEIEAPVAGGPATFSTSGKKIVFPGYLRAYVEGSDDPAADIGDQETILPDLREGQSIDRRTPTAFKGVGANEHVTQPPARYTEASLVKKLEEEGIGRPSTYASILGTIQARGYVFRQKSGNAMVPTFTAMAVTNLMRRHFGNYVDIGFTARMEDELDEIAEGKRDWVDYVRAFWFGQNADGIAGTDGASAGLVRQIETEVERIGLPDVPVGNDPKSGKQIMLRIGRYGPYLVRGEGGEGNTANVPENTAPADLTAAEAAQLIERKAEGPRKVGTDPKTGMMVYAVRGRFGPYVQLGEAEGDTKPKRASLPKDMTEDNVDIDTALMLLALPRELGTHPETGLPIIANAGRFGPYVQMDRDFRSLKDGDDVYTIGLERALALLAEPKGARRGGTKQSKTVLKALGENDGKKIEVLDGRYGPYVSDGETHATLPKGQDPQATTLELAVRLIEQKAAAGPAKKGARKGAKKAAAPKGAKKAAKKAAKKSAK